MQQVYLREVYTWFHQKLVTMGMLSKQEIDKEQSLMNPMARSLSASMTKMIKHKVLSSLVNEEETREYYKQMYEEDLPWYPAERSLHTAIPPANVRI